MAAVLAGLVFVASTPLRANALAAPGVQVMVANDGVLDVVVYAYHNGLRVRLGLVAAHSQGVVTIPDGMATPGRVQLLVHAMTGDDFVVDEVAIRQNEEHAVLHVTLPLISRH